MKNANTEQVAEKAVENAFAAGQAALEQCVEMAGTVMKTGYQNSEKLAEEQAKQAREAQSRVTELAAGQIKVAESVGAAVLANGVAACQLGMDFAKDSTGRNLDTLLALARTRDPSAWMKIQLDSLNDAGSRMARHTVAWSELVQESVAGVFGPFVRTGKPVAQTKEAATTK